MAEIGLIASVIGVAGAGIKLSITLYTFSETVTTAADSIRSIAKDVSLTSAVLEELGSNLRQDEQARLYSGAALRTAQTVVVDCEAVFKQIDSALSKSMERIFGLASREKSKGKGGKVVLSAIERMKWPFLQPKMEELRANLERLKSTLVLMLNVLTYARKIHTEKQSQPPKDDYQRLLIENLVAANQEATQNFQMLLKTIGPSDDTGSIMTASTRELSIGESTLVAERVPPDQMRTSSSVAEEADFKQQQSALDMSLADQPRDVPALEDNSGIGQFTISGRSSATETTVACLKRIQEALDHFEASEDKIACATQMKVSIEVCKHILHSGAGPIGRKPWEVTSIIQHHDGKVLGPDYSNEVPRPASTRLTAGILHRPEENKPYRQLGSSQRTAALQAQMDDIVNIMQANQDKIVHRSERIDSLQDKTENLSLSTKAFRKAANRAERQQGWLSTLSTAWNNLPSARATIASADEFLQEKFAAAFYNGSRPEDDKGAATPGPEVSGSAGGSDLTSPIDVNTSEPTSVFLPTSPETKNETGLGTGELPDFLEDVPTISTTQTNQRRAPQHDGHMTQERQQTALYYQRLQQGQDSRDAGKASTDLHDTPLRQGREGFRIRTTSSAVAGIKLAPSSNEFSTPLSPPRSSITLVTAEKEPSGRADEVHAQLRSTNSIGRTEDINLEFLLKEWTTLYD